jgi:hypothetical protein
MPHGIVTLLALVGSGVIGLAVGDLEGLVVGMTGTGSSYSTFPTLYVESSERHEIFETVHKHNVCKLTMI